MLVETEAVRYMSFAVSNKKVKAGKREGCTKSQQPSAIPSPQRLPDRDFFQFDVRQAVNRKHYLLLNVHLPTQTVLETIAIVSTIIESKSPSPIFVPLQMRSTTVLNEQTPPPPFPVQDHSENIKKLMGFLYCSLTGSQVLSCHTWHPTGFTDHYYYLTFSCSIQ